MSNAPQRNRVYLEMLAHAKAAGETRADYIQMNHYGQAVNPGYVSPEGIMAVLPGDEHPGSDAVVALRERIYGSRP